MRHEEQRIWLLQQLLAEDSHYREYSIPETNEEQKDLLRALMNVRMPKPVSDKFLNIQDEYLSEEIRRGGTVDASLLPPISTNTKIALWQGDITTLKIDAIVNAANSGMTGCYHPLHNCIDNIIHTKAGIELRLKCNEIMKAQGHGEEVGGAKITPAYNLPCKYVIHTVGPMIQGKLTSEDCEQLKSCYTSILDCAVASGVKTVAFCCISTGVFMFPNEKACEIAVDTVSEYLKEHKELEKVVFNVFKDTDHKLYLEQLKQVIHNPVHNM